MTGRRFVAGAVCPGCSNLDTMYLESTATQHVRRCTRCDYTDSIDRTTGAATQTQPVRILEPGELSPPQDPSRKS